MNSEKRLLHCQVCLVSVDVLGGFVAAIILEYFLGGEVGWDGGGKIVEGIIIENS